MKIEYQLKGNGWAEITLQDSNQFIEIPVSYLHDSLRDLTESALKLRKGIKQTEVSFVDEPGEFRLVFESDNDGKVKVEVQRYNNWPTKKQNPDEMILQFQTTVDEISKQVLNILRQIEKEYGEEKYLEAWINHEFPKVEYKRLQAI